MKNILILFILLCLGKINCSESSAPINYESAAIQFEIEVKKQEEIEILNKIESIEFGLVLSRNNSREQEVKILNQLFELRQKLFLINNDLLELTNKLKK